MSITGRFLLTEKRKIIRGDKSPVYVFEAIDNPEDEAQERRGFALGAPLGRMKLRVDSPRAQRILKESDEFYVEISPCKKKK